MRQRRRVELRLLIEVIPPAPPCFAAAMQWREYLHSAIAGMKSGALDLVERPIVIVGGKAQVNPAWNFCGDCSRDYRAQMKRCGRCRPDHLREWCERAKKGKA